LIGILADDGEYLIDMAKKVIYNICVRNAKNRSMRENTDKFSREELP
jgi:hypothetical protein